MIRAARPKPTDAMRDSPAAPAPFLLVADDFAIAPGVDDAIAALAEARRISATSALVTLPEWPEAGRRLAALRHRIAIGLHINLTLGTPCAAVPGLAPDGALPTVGQLIAMATTRRIDRAEIAAEVTRQLDAFEHATGYQPDHVDGHQHVHALPVVRDGVLAALAARGYPRPPLVRVPADRTSRILARGLYPAKALTLTSLALGFADAARRAGFPVNDGFSGISAFDRTVPYADELARAATAPGRRHLVMCHPGQPDTTLASRDPVVDRRADEYAALLAATGLPARIFHPERAAGGPAIDWNAAWPSRSTAAEPDGADRRPG